MPGRSGTRRASGGVLLRTVAAATAALVAVAPAAPAFDGTSEGVSGRADAPAEEGSGAAGGPGEAGLRGAGAGEGEGPSGAAAMAASAVYPGLGQLLNGKEHKSAVLSAVEVLLVAGLLVEDRRTRNALRLYEQTGDEDYFDDYSEHYDRRQTLVWWVVIAALYGLTDAYVDAHLADFEVAPAGSGDPFSAGTEYGAGLRVSLAVRF